MIMRSGFHFHHHETWFQKKTRSHVKTPPPRQQSRHARHVSRHRHNRAAAPLLLIVRIRRQNCRAPEHHSGTQSVCVNNAKRNF